MYTFKDEYIIFCSTFFFRNILQQNGSAVDATIAAMFCNGIVNMQSMGLGGGFLMTVYIRENKTAYFLNAREAAPLKAKEELFKDDEKSSKNGKTINIFVILNIFLYF